MIFGDDSFREVHHRERQLRLLAERAQIIGDPAMCGAIADDQDRTFRLRDELYGLRDAGGIDGSWHAAIIAWLLRVESSNPGLVGSTRFDVRSTARMPPARFPGCCWRRTPRSLRPGRATPPAAPGPVAADLSTTALQRMNREDRGAVVRHVVGWQRAATFALDDAAFLHVGLDVHVGHLKRQRRDRAR